MHEETICRAIDLIAENREQDAEKLLDDCISVIKKQIGEGNNQLDNYYAWGMCLSIMEEYEQAILKFEQALQLNPNHENAMWQISSILFQNLGKWEAARSILEEKLIKLAPDNPEYREALQSVKTCLKHSNSEIDNNSIMPAEKRKEA